MRKNRIRLTESQLHRVIKESVNKILNEIGDTNRGQYMLGRSSNRSYKNGDRVVRDNVADRLGDTDELQQSFNQGWNDEENNVNYRQKNFNYRANNTQDMDNLGRSFINFIEKHEGGSLIQYIVDCETGNEAGEPISPLPEVISEYEEAMLNGDKATPEMRKAFKRAYNEWWYYAEPQLIGEE